MAKIDKSILSKDEAKAAIELRRKLKKSKPQVNNCPNTIFNIVCIKEGVKYDHSYVNKLYYGVAKNLTLPFNFFCLTENAYKIDSNVKIIPLPEIPNIKGWWYKPYIFSNDIPIKGVICYVDLDVVITNSLDHLLTHRIDSFLICRDFNRVLRPNYDKFNSSVMKFPKGKYNFLWDKFVQSKEMYMKKFYGDQDYIFDLAKNIAEFFPDDWIRSWKWEIRKSRKYAPGVRGQRKLAQIEDVIPPETCSIAVFHGDPNPHLCDDPYIKKTWIYKE